MKHDKGLLKADKLAAFREWLVAAGFEVRDGKGEFQCLQVKTAPTCWAVVGRNTAGVLSTHPDLRALINRFNSGEAREKYSEFKGEKAFKNFHGRLCERFGYQHDPVDWWRDQVSLEEHIASLVAEKPEPAPAPADSFLEDLRDDFAMYALQGMISTAGAPCLLGLEGGESDTAKAAYKIADAMLEARKVGSAPTPSRTPRKSDKWSSDWKANGFNGCMSQASKALRYLASNDRPNGGESSFNFEHLIQLADELELTKSELLAP